MHVALSHLSAFMLCRTAGRPDYADDLPLVLDAELFSEKRVRLSAGFTPDFDKELLSQLASRYGLVEPLDCLYANSSQRRKTSASLHRVCRRLPSDLFLAFEKNRYVAAPELALLQIAPLVSRIELLSLAFEFCGRYALDPGHPDGFWPRPPLTTPERIQSLASALQGQLGSENYRFMATHVRAGSESPQETAMYLRICLPTDVGSRGISEGIPNFEVSLSEKASAIYGKKLCRVDLYFPEGNIGLEYQSKQHHDGAANLDKDSRRAVALRMEGIELIPVTNQAMKDDEYFDDIVGELAKKLGKRLRYRGQGYWEKNAELTRETRVKHDKDLYWKLAGLEPPKQNDRPDYEWGQSQAYDGL